MWIFIVENPDTGLGIWGNTDVICRFLRHAEIV